MFDDEELPAGVTWERKKVQKFRMEQDRLGEEGSCVSTYRFSYPPSVLSLSPSYLSLSVPLTCLSLQLSGVGSSGVLAPYFSNVTAVLQQQVNSDTLSVSQSVCQM